MSLRVGSSLVFSFTLLALACGDDGSGGSGGEGNATTTTGGQGSGAGPNGGASSSGGANATGGSGGSSSTVTPGCTDNAGCPAGQICEANSCVDGCAPDHGCAAGASCCDGQCFDLGTDVLHCGSCDTVCPTPPNIDVTCNNVCTYGSCQGTFQNCDGDVSNGCESAGACTCIPGTSQPCYDGPPNTLGVGSCVAGVQICNQQGTGWGFCMGEVLPALEVCANGTDEDCNGAADDVVDADGDGWTYCDGDCCDVAGPGCNNPELVNPGAFEVGGNTVDDDCDGTVDNPLTGCDTGLASNSATGTDYAKAVDLCQFTTANPPLPQKKWGVISASFSLADGTGTPAAVARSIRPGFGAGVTPLGGQSLAVLSTGHAAAQAAPNNVNPAFASFQSNTDNGTQSGVPADWLTANGNNFPNAPGCPDPQGGTTAHDPIMLTLSVRVPTNANSFSLRSFFYSSEYPEWVCSPFNDFFVTLLTSSFAGMPANPADKNLAFFDPLPAGPPYYPLGVNLASGNTGLFNQCVNGQIGCGGGAVLSTTNACTGTNQLTGTGFDVVNPAPPPQYPGDPGYCGANNLLGGGTGWLTTSGNVVPGETITLRFATWDVGDQYYDSLVLLDNFVWSVTASTPGTKEN